MINLYATLLYLPILYLFFKFFFYYYQKDKNGKKKVSGIYFMTYIVGVSILLLLYITIWGVIGDQLSYSGNSMINATGSALLIGAYVIGVYNVVFIFFAVFIWMVLGIGWMTFGDKK